MRIKEKRILKNGAVAGYVYNSLKSGNGELLVVPKKKGGSQKNINRIKKVQYNE